MSHDAIHRAVRELYAATRQLRDHWAALSRRLEDVEPLRAGVETAEQLLRELPEQARRHSVPLGPAARMAGGAVAAPRDVLGDRLLERNQALRLALLDGQHVATLLEYVARLAAVEGDKKLQAFAQQWAERLEERVAALREVAISAGDRPDEAVEPIHERGHRFAHAVGSLGEAIDRRLSR